MPEQWKSAYVNWQKMHKWMIKEWLPGGCPVVDIKRVAFMIDPSDPRDSAEVFRVEQARNQAYRRG